MGEQDILNGMAQQQAPDPFTPQGMPSVVVQLNAYRQRNKQILGEAEEITNMVDSPFKPETVDPEKLAEGKTDHQVWLETQPVSAEQPSQFSQQKYMHTIMNLQNDNAYQEIHNNFWDTLKVLRQHVEQGMPIEQAHEILKEAGPMIEEALYKYHGDHSPSKNYSLTTHPDLHMEDTVVRKARGGK